MSRRGRVGHWPGAWVLGAAALAVLVAPPLRAQDAAQPQAQAVRLSYVDGDVRIAQGGQVLADPALANTPLFAGTQVTTGDDGRAELQFEDGSVARLAPNSSLTLTSLSGPGEGGGTAAGGAEIVLNGGLGYFELQGATQGEQIQIHFADSTVTASGSAVLRIDMDKLPGELAVFSGNAHLQRSDALTMDLQGGESITLSAADSSQYVLAGTIEPDSWDAWNADRDQALTAEATDRTGAAESAAASEAGGQVDADNPAWNDLDANGNWYNVPGVGEVWSPYDAASAGWDPYGDGSWMWTPGFGYVWISGASWGYLPYQCGAWNYYDGFGWGWTPGGGRPWWRRGGWAYRIGHAPFGYHFPDRPHGGDGGWRHDHDGGPHQAGYDRSLHPVVAVHRLSGGGPADHGRAEFVARDRYSAATIAGHIVQPLRPIASRPLYHGAPSAVAIGSRPAYAGGWTRAGQQSIHSYSAGPARSYVSPVRSYSSPARSYGGSRSSSSHFSSGGSFGRSGGGGSRGGGGGANHGGHR